MWRKCITGARKVVTVDTVTTAADLAAIALVTCGVALIFAPAAFITAGILIGALSWYVSRPPNQDRDAG